MSLWAPPPPVPPKFGTFEYTAVSVDAASPLLGSASTRSSSSFYTTHVRRRSSVDLDRDVSIHLDAPAGNRNLAAKEYERSIVEKQLRKGPQGMYTTTGGAGKGYLTWTDSKASGRRTGTKGCVALVAVLLIVIVGWLGGLATSEVSSRRLRQSLLANLRGHKAKQCDPYALFGVLNVNTSEPSENVWRPLTTAPECQPVDYMTLLRQASVGEPVSPLIEFARDRTIVLFGDSVDREHNEHMCQFLSGWHEMIGHDHPLSPRYPVGQEVPPEGYQSFINGKREWPNWFQSRPYVCHIPQLNLRILNVFHYGFQPVDFDDSYITTHPHFYPPGTVEERFDQIVVPLVANVAQKYNTSPVPDVFSVSPGFWTMLRQSVADQSHYRAAVDAGAEPDDAKKRYDVWRSFDEKEKAWHEARIEGVLRHVGQAWRAGKDGEGRIRPTLLWRALHPIKETDTVPASRTAALDQIGRHVVSQLVDEAQAARSRSRSSWKEWTKSFRAAKAFGWTTSNQDEVIREDLADRLRVDDWGKLMLGQSTHFRDEVHPLALPGSYLYGNMLFHQLRTTVDAQRQA
ncbi:hypothetical protein JCM10212_003645 [Sporobolomyces blumeae]